MARARRIERLGLRQPVGGLEQLRQVVEADGDVGVVGAVGCSSMASARRISGSASASRLVAWSNCARLLRRWRRGMVGAVGLLVDGQRPAHQRLGLGQAVGGLEQLRQVVEADGDVGVLGAVGLLVDGQRRRISGSASARRFVAWSNSARLLRPMATLGCSAP